MSGTALQSPSILTDILEPRVGWFYKWMPRWTPSSPELLRDSEEAILNYISDFVDSEGFYVNSGQVRGETAYVWTRKFVRKGRKYTVEEEQTPIVMLHGMGAGLAMFALNLAALTQLSPVYAADLPGFARSSRPSFSSDSDTAEEQYVSCIEQWRANTGLQKINLIGHSFGGYLSAAYALRHPERINQLILADSWGLSAKPEDPFADTRFSWKFKALFSVVVKFNPLALLRASGPMGPNLLAKARPDLAMKFADLVGEENIGIIGNYLYHCNAHTPSGEAAFHSISNQLVWATNPMLPRLQQAKLKVPISFLFGSDSWIYNRVSNDIPTIHELGDVVMIPSAGHHIYADQDEFFNSVIKKIVSRGRNTETVGNTSMPSDQGRRLSTRDEL